jgi:hypothetical protein
MMILSILATVVLLGVLFYHRVSFPEQPDSAGLDGCAWRRRSLEYLAFSSWPSFCCRLTLPDA